MMSLEVQQSQQERKVEPTQLLNDVGRDHVTFLILALTCHHQLSQVHFQVPDVMFQTEPPLLESRVLREFYQ